MNLRWEMGVVVNGKSPVTVTDLAGGVRGCRILSCLLRTYHEMGNRRATRLGSDYVPCPATPPRAWAAQWSEAIAAPQINAGLHKLNENRPRDQNKKKKKKKRKKRNKDVGAVPK